MLIATNLWACTIDSPEPEAKFQSQKFAASSEQRYVGQGDERLSYFNGGNDSPRDDLVIFLMGPEAYYRFNEAGRSFDYIERYRSNENTDKVDENVRLVSSLTGSGFIFLALPGSFGSNGSRHEQHAMGAVEAVDSAIEELKRRYKSRRVSVAAQSAAAAIAAVLPARRDDIRCLSLSSGVYDWPAILHANNWPSTYAGTRNPLSALEAVAGYKRAPERKIIVMADPLDRRVPFSQSEAFSRSVSASGHAVELLSLSSSIDQIDHHNLQTEAVLALSRCVRKA